MSSDLDSNSDVRDFIQAETLENQDDLDWEPTDSKNTYNDHDHSGHALLSAETLPRNARTGNALPEPEEHPKVKETDDGERDCVRSEHENKLKRDVVVVLHESADLLVLVGVPIKKKPLKGNPALHNRILTCIGGGGSSALLLKPGSNH